MVSGGRRADRVVRRDRLLDRLAPRPGELIVISGGPGMGKSTLLSQLRDQRSAAGWSIVALRGDRLGRFDPASRFMSASADVPDIEPHAFVNALWNLAPTPVAVLVDDAHLLGESERTSLIELIERLPGNAGLVMAGRGSLSRLVAAACAHGEPVMVSEHDLLFDDDELTLFTGDVGPTRTESLRWPAWSTLASFAGADVADAYVWQEVLRHLSAAQRRVVAVAARIGVVDADLLRACCPGIDDMRGLMRSVPLVFEHAPDTWEVHALWQGALDGELDDDTLATIDHALIERAVDAGDVESALDHAAAAGDWERLLQLAIELAGDHGRELLPERLLRWTTWLPTGYDGRLEVRLLEAIVQMRTDLDESYARIAQLLDEFEAAGSVAGELAALRQLTRIAVWAEDPGKLTPLIDRVARKVAAGHEEFAPLDQLNGALIASVLGDAAGVLDIVSQRLIEQAPTFEPLFRWLRGFALLDTGEPERAQQEGERGLAVTSTAGFALPLEALVIEATFENAGVEAALERLRDLMSTVEHTGIEQFIGTAAVRLVAAYAFVGETDLAVEVREQYARQIAALDSTPLQVQRVLADVAIDIAAGRDDSARRRIVEAMASHPIDGRASQGAWSRHAAVVAALVPEAASGAWALTEYRLRACRLARAMRRLRASEADPTIELATDDLWQIDRHLPRRWIAELANAAPRETAEVLVKRLGRDAARQLRVAGEASGVRNVLHLVPHTPTEPLCFSLLGPFEVLRGDRPVVDQRLSRARVRELLALLVHAGGSVDRSVIAARMWPDLAHAAGGRNLRVNLSHLIGALEPERAPNTPSFFVRQVGSRLELAEDLLTVDVVEFDRELRAAHEAERERRPDLALEMYRRGLRWWRGHPDVYDDVAWAPGEAERLRSTFVTAAVRASDLLVAAGDHLEAVALAHAAMQAQPWSLEPVRVAVSAARATSRADGHLLERARAIAAELGVEVPEWVAEPEPPRPR